MTETRDPTSAARKPLTLYTRARRSVAEAILTGTTPDPTGAGGADVAGIELSEQPPPPSSIGRPSEHGEGAAAGGLETALLVVEGLTPEQLRGHESSQPQAHGRSWTVPAVLLREHATVREQGERTPDIERVREREKQGAPPVPDERD